LATKLLEKYGNAITQLILTPSSGGIFDITKNDILIFSKKNEGRFPDIDEIFTLLD
jgi:selenoprotein W-related protein